METQPLQQAEKTPDVPITRKKAATGPRAPGGTLLAGATGVDFNSINTGANTLLGA
ncbi:hypothetical protein [Dongia sp.]|uniref:hypothetical protein n=1 Tax=Dongia sp. TaxID=1977262 RepID=UPI0035B15680